MAYAECTCDPDEEPFHTCPYAKEISDDDKLCACCQVCERECADDI